MNIILAFLGVCMVLGLWIKPRARQSGIVVITILAFLLVIVFWLYPTLF